MTIGGTAVGSVGFGSCTGVRRGTRDLLPSRVTACMLQVAGRCDELPWNIVTALLPRIDIRVVMMMLCS